MQYYNVFVFFITLSEYEKCIPVVSSFSGITGATRCQILGLKCTNVHFSWGSGRPRPHWGSLQHSLRPLAVFKGSTSNGREGRGKREEEGGKGKGRGEEGRKGRNGRRQGP